MNYKDAQEYLQEVRERGTKLSLDNIKKIIDNLPFSLSKIKFIQVAGTNGKGSTSHFIASILIANGYKTGLFTSPHLLDIKERITVDKDWISEEDFGKNMGEVKKFLIDIRRKKIIDEYPTFFEHLLLLSLFYFNSKKTDFAVLEVGLGGRLDATTAIIPIVSVITGISLEHTKTLGKRISDIAFEKAGISKKNIPLVNSTSKFSIASKVIKNVCNENGAKYFQTFDKYNILKTKFENNQYYCTYKTNKSLYNYTLRMNGIHQTRNAATAIKALELAGNNVILDNEKISEGIRNNFVPARVEFIEGTPNVIIDGGHNVQGIGALVEYLKTNKFYNNTLIFGVLRDKKYRKMINMLKPFIDNVILVEPMSKRALEIDKLIPHFNKKISKISKFKDDYSSGLKKALEIKKPIIITGSFYMVGEMRKLLFKNRNRGENEY